MTSSRCDVLLHCDAVACSALYRGRQWPTLLGQKHPRSSFAAFSASTEGKKGGGGGRQSAAASNIKHQTGKMRCLATAAPLFLFPIKLDNATEPVASGAEQLLLVCYNLTVGAESPFTAVIVKFGQSFGYGHIITQRS